MHSVDIIHRDLKPANILINKAGKLKVADFGLARYIRDVAKKVEPVLTDYVATRWYRPPEVVLGAPIYDAKVDIWAFGCIIAEMYVQKPIFPGSSTLNQLQRILEFTGIPDPRDLAAIHSPLALSVFEKLVQKETSKTIDDLVPAAPPAAKEIIQAALTFAPNKRPTASELLEMPWLQHFHKHYGGSQQGS